uniref:Uncharacterized protein n=1 Tax=Oryza rufipogon TaxID=4529 RepID=A0A0E0RH41_ORYRU
MDRILLTVWSGHDQASMCCAVGLASPTVSLCVGTALLVIDRDSTWKKMTTGRLAYYAGCFG